MKRFLILCFVILTATVSRAQEASNDKMPATLCESIDALLSEAPNGFYKYQGEQLNEKLMNSLFAFPGSYKSTIEMNSGVPVFKAYLEESNDKDVLLKSYDTAAADIKSCLSKKYVVEEKMMEDGIGRMMIVKHKRRKRNKVKIFLEFSKADMATASYHLRLNVMNEN